MINYESGRAYALSSFSQDILQNPEVFAQWCNQFVAALKQPVVIPQPVVQQVVAPQGSPVPQITIYTDGACSGNPGPGGWGAVLMRGEYIKEISDAEPATTNNRMELLAAIRALSALKKPCSVTLYSDSEYLINPFNRRWLEGWQKNGWRNSRKEAVENRDLWEQLVVLTTKHSVTFVKVKGHSDNEWNNRCDQLAREAYKQLLKEAAA